MFVYYEALTDTQEGNQETLGHSSMFIHSLFEAMSGIRCSLGSGFGVYRYFKKGKLFS